VRVRQFELRLLAAALTILWAVGGGIVLVAYRPGGPIDLLVGVAALLPLLLSVAAVVWPPLVRGYGGLAAVFWLGLGAGLLLIPSIVGIIGQIVNAGTEPLLPSLEVMYPWVLALLATSLFAGLGVTRELFSETGLERRRVVASAVFAVVSTGLIGAVFAGVSLADATLGQQFGGHSRFGPTSPDVVLPSCFGPIAQAGTAQISLDISGDVDGQAIGRVGLSGVRSGSDVSWTATIAVGGWVVQRGGVRLGASAWTLDPGGGWQSVASEPLDIGLLDARLLDTALSPGNRATAEDRGIEVVEGARARHCRVAVDGDTYLAAVPEVGWLTGGANPSAWRGQIDFWIFGDGEIGKANGMINGAAEGIRPGVLVTVRFSLTATERDAEVMISPPTSTVSPGD
jgi:hypothetical protein